MRCSGFLDIKIRPLGQLLRAYNRKSVSEAAIMNFLVKMTKCQTSHGFAFSIVCTTRITNKAFHVPLNTHKPTDYNKCYDRISCRAAEVYSYIYLTK